MNNPLLLIDGRNALYRAIYASKADRRHRIKYHPIVIFMRQLTKWMNLYRPSSVHVFWDAPRSQVWRKLILDSYKDRSNSDYVRDISGDLIEGTQVAYELFQVMNIRQYARKQMEADDLIYAAASLVHPKPSVTVSTDCDMIQIPFTFSSSRVYDPKREIEHKIPTHSPVLLKALVGDKSDNIDGYRGIGPVKGKELINQPTQLQNFLNTEGHSTFRRNILLVDLSLCPRLLANRLYIQKVMSTQVQYDRDAIADLAHKHKLMGFMSEFANLTSPFINLE